MPKIHFTVKDLARTRLRTTLGPVADAVIALGAVRRGGYPPYAGWRNQVIAQLHNAGGPVARLASPRSLIRAPDDLLSLLDPAPTSLDAAALALNMTRQQLTVTLLAFWRVAVAPHWSRIRAHLELDCDARGRISMIRGVAELLATLHPKIVWEPPVLDCPDGSNRDVFLGGRGLLLSPSIFLVDRPGLFLDSVGPEHQPALVFAAPPAPARSAALWDSPGDPGVALGALIGHTRAAALRELTEVHTTRQLADRLGISPAGASQHTTVLRQAGLITTRRVRNTALHTVTALGMTLLNGGELAAGHGMAS
jgi:DNA-binding transcriptional ArsR family regulator